MKKERDRAPWELPRRLPIGFWRRAAVLWSFAPVPFSRAFEGEAEEARLARVEDHLRATEEG
jgi:hypothetical protein